ncbi:MAG: phospholipase D-like domain-containing protein [bacterium]|nr:phospholipase D-like domain-containing protein [bacterium]
MHTISLLEQTVGIPFTHDNSVEVLKNGDEIFPAMLTAIENATQSVDFLTFVYWEGNIAEKFAEALSEKASQGIQVRVLLDAFGALPMNKALLDKMKEAGAHVIWFRPLARWKIWKSDNRTHRKILICDDQVAFTGGVGIAQEWEGDARNPNEWRETHFKLNGSAVRGIKSAFVENWIEATDALNHDLFKSDDHPSSGTTSVQVLRTSASVRWSDIVLLYQTLLSSASKKIHICTAYFNPDDALVEILCKKAAGGVDVKIILPGSHTDKRVSKIAAEDIFEPLLASDIELYYYQKTMMHAKILLVDDEVSCFGSANFNHRSMLKDDEINLVAIDKALNTELDAHFEEDLSNSERVTRQRWKRRPLSRRMYESAIRLIKDEI